MVYSNHLSAPAIPRVSEMAGVFYFLSEEARAMCIAVTAKILSVQGSRARAVCMGNAMDIELGLVDAAPGDYVLVHAGCAIQRVTSGEAEEFERLYEELTEAYDEDS